MKKTIWGLIISSSEPNASSYQFSLLPSVTAELNQRSSTSIYLDGYSFVEIFRTLVTFLGIQPINDPCSQFPMNFLFHSIVHICSTLASKTKLSCRELEDLPS